MWTRVVSIDTHTADVGGGRGSSRAGFVLGRAGNGWVVRVRKSAICGFWLGLEVRGGVGWALHPLQVEREFSASSSVGSGSREED